MPKYTPRDHSDRGQTKPTQPMPSASKVADTKHTSAAHKPMAARKGTGC